MRIEEPSLLGWILGRLANPVVRDPCRQCGRVRADSEAVARLRDEGLVRVAEWSAVCPACKRASPPSSERAGVILRVVSAQARAMLSKATVYEPAGCAACSGSGYRGRTGIFEVLRVTEAIEDLIIKRASVPLIRAHARAEGMRTLRDAGLRKVALGETSVAEVLEHTIADAEEPAPAAMGTPHHA